jgi:hypothetical protein
MDQLLGRCSETLIAWLAGSAPAGASPLAMRLRASRGLKRQVRMLDSPYSQVLVWQFGIGQPPLNVSDIARRLGISEPQVEELVDDALAALGWSLLDGSLAAAGAEVAA